ncbi:hypothetical protein BDR03DRAFT_252123 [Suillus americanus]|nr:hypothetical protein BDR03DRAFT_252123 [Suillus americanus]
MPENVCPGYVITAMQGATSNPCVNTKLQRNDTKAVEIKGAEYGLGAFAAQDMKTGDFIGDYVGNLMTLDDVDVLDEVAKYSGRNYFFEFSGDNEEEMLDAAPVGNATRFLNHATVERANCEARILLVNGEHHIGFYTTKAVARGKELFLCYGETYWLNKGVN